MTRALEILVRDRTGLIVGQLEDYSSLTLVKRWRDVGAWTLQAPVTDLSTLVGTPGYSIVVRKQGVTLLSGPMAQSTFSRDDTGVVISASGFCDLVRLWDALALPCPYPYTARSNDIRTGIAESVIKGYITDNAIYPVRNGGASDTEVLSVVPDLARGSVVTGNARFDQLGDLVQSLAVAGGLGMNADDLMFDVYQSVDRSREQVFSFASGNLATYSITRNGPSCTLAVAAGQGDGTARTFVQTTLNNEPEWGREVERFFDQRQTNDLVELAQKNDEELAKGQATTQIAITPIDTPDRTYGTDWNLGDTVTCEGVVSVVTELNVTYDDKGLVIKPTVAVGGNQAHAALRIFDEVRTIRRRLNALERAQ